MNIPFAIVAAAGAYFVIREPEGGRNRSPLDIPGVILSTLGLVSLVYGFTRAESEGWSDAVTIGMFVASAVLLTAFVVVEARVKSPLLPLRVITDRNRGGIYLSLGLAIIAMFGLFLFLTYYLQIVKGYSPVKTGFAFLPMIVGMITGSTQIGTRLMTRVAPRLLMGPGFLVAALGMLLLTQLEIDTSYSAVLLPGMLLLGLGMGTAFIAGHVPGHPGRRAARLRCRLRDGQHLAAGGRRDRYGAAEHDRRVGHDLVHRRPHRQRRHPLPAAAGPAGGHGEGLHQRDLVRRRHPGRRRHDRPDLREQPASRT